MKTLAEAVMEDAERWDSQFAHELIQDLKREVEDGGWDAVEVWDTIRKKCADYRLQPHNPHTEELAKAARMFIPGSVARGQAVSSAIRAFDDAANIPDSTQ